MGVLVIGVLIANDGPDDSTADGAGTKAIGSTDKEASALVLTVAHMDAGWSKAEETGSSTDYSYTMQRGDCCPNVITTQATIFSSQTAAAAAFAENRSLVEEDHSTTNHEYGSSAFSYNMGSDAYLRAFMVQGNVLWEAELLSGNEPIWLTPSIARVLSLLESNY